MLFTDKFQVSYSIVNLASFKSIKDFTDDFLSKHSQLDILINNAGVMQPPFDVTEDKFESHVGINYLGHFYLTHLLSELLVKCKSKVVVVASEAHKEGNISLTDLEGEMPLLFKPPAMRTFKLDFMRYGMSNRARIYFAKELVVRHPQLTAMSLHPGVIRTSLNRNMGGCVKGMVFCMGCFFKSPEQGAATTIHCATKDMSEHLGDYFIDSVPSVIKEGQIDPEVQVKLWDVTMDLIQKNGK